MSLARLETLWFNTGSLCNITCDNCYINSSPRNDRLAYLTPDDVRAYLDEVAEAGWPLAEVGLTGGEPFLNRDLPAILAGDPGARPPRAGPDQRDEADAPAPAAVAGAARTLWRSAGPAGVDRPLHAGEARGGARAGGPGHRCWRGLHWLCANGFPISVASRTVWHEPEADVRAGFAGLLAAEGLPLDALDPARLVLFPEMDMDAAGAGNHHAVLGHPRRCPGADDVRHLAHGAQAQGRHPSGGGALHPAALRSAVRARPPPERRQDDGQAQPPLLRPVLRPRRRLVFGPLIKITDCQCRLRLADD